MRFKVTGNHRVAGVVRGGTVDMDETDPRTLALVKAGHLSPPKKKTPVGEHGPELIKLPKGDD